MIACCSDSRFPRFTWPEGPAALGTTLRRIAVDAEGAGVVELLGDGPLLPDPRGRPVRGRDARRLHRPGLRRRRHRADHARHAGHRRHVPASRRCSSRPSPRSTSSPAAAPGSASAPRGTRRSTSASACRSRRSPSASSGSRRRCRSALRMWSGDESPYDGTHYRPRRLLNSPQSLQRPHPRILIGGMGEKKTLRLVAKYADACNLFELRDEAAFRHKLDVLQQHCEDEGRDYAEIERTTLGTLRLSRDGAEGTQSLDQAVDRFGRLAELGRRPGDRQLAAGVGPGVLRGAAATSSPRSARSRRPAGAERRVFAKILVANRGEIAVRAFRAAYELGARTVAVFPWEDRDAVHRIKADESYLIGERGHPVRAYLDVDEIVRVAREAGADAVYPGYGFLSENPAARRAPARRPASRSSGRRPACSRSPATRCGRSPPRARPGSRCCAPRRRPRRRRRARRGRGRRRLPAVRQGGRRRRRARHAAGRRRRRAPGAARRRDARGRRRVRRPDGVPRAGGRPARGTSRCRCSPTPPATTIHLFERDCSVQRRHQKVVEIAPAPALDPALRERLCARRRPLRRARSGTSTPAPSSSSSTPPERDAGSHVFIEMNPRIQVEHTVTEEVTDVDLVQAQMRIAAGETLADLGLSQESIRLHGVALQCRVTTEDPAQRVPARHRHDHHLPLARRRRRPARRRHRRTPARRSARTSTRCW